LIGRRGGYDDHSGEVLLRGGTDDLFTVKVDNLPDGFQQSDLEDLLFRRGCNYFTKVVIPRNRETQVLQSLAFVKFTRLRYALKFYEDFQKTRARDRVLNTVLVL
jgi:RNA recognition motif-containing protein